MILITSAAYVDPQLRNEFGLLPPTFLPVGNKRLFEHQVGVLRNQFPGEKIFISLPSSFEIGKKDLSYLTANKIHIIQIEDGLSLPASISFALRKFIANDGCIRILHGDTLLGSIPNELDLIAVANTREDYLWEVENVDATSELVWCGYFSFSNIDLIKRCLEEPDISFSQAIKIYAQVVPIQRILVYEWSDFGHINTYFHSRTKITTERSFNSLSIKDGCVYKSGYDDLKISAESSWYEKLPSTLRIYCPQLIDLGINEHGKAFYALEYLAIPPVNEIFVHGANPIFYWDKIFRLCIDFLEACKLSFPKFDDSSRIDLDSSNLNNEKTISRLEAFFLQNGYLGWSTNLTINGKPVGTIGEVFKNCLELSKRIPVIPGILHGDLCFSNILFDSRSDRIKVIDPRGLDGLGEISNFGDLAYDVAKLTHSVVGLYDYIVAGAYKLDTSFSENQFNANLNIFTDERLDQILNLFCTKKFDTLTSPLEVMPLTILLFLSMLPLHADNPNRQMALFSNALRLYSIFIIKDEV